MRKLQAFNPQFQIQYNSCSTLAPSNFNWCHEPSELEAVFLDASIPEGLKLKMSTKKYAWLVESPDKRI